MTYAQLTMLGRKVFPDIIKTPQSLNFLGLSNESLILKDRNVCLPKN